jgi:hypothetical protein
MVLPPTRPDWPFVGLIIESTTAHAHQLAEEAKALQKAFQARKGTNTNIPGSKLLPFCRSIETFVEKFLN